MSFCAFRPFLVVVDDELEEFSVVELEEFSAIEDGRPSEGPNAPALDENGLPNDDTAIAQDALGANEDQSQG